MKLEGLPLVLADKLQASGRHRERTSRQVAYPAVGLDLKAVRSNYEKELNACMLPITGSGTPPPRSTVANPQVPGSNDSSGHPIIGAVWRGATDLDDPFRRTRRRRHHFITPDPQTNAAESRADVWKRRIAVGDHPTRKPYPHDLIMQLAA